MEDESFHRLDKESSLQTTTSGRMMGRGVLRAAGVTDIQKMDEETQKVLFNLIDTYIQNFKTKQEFAR